MMIIKLISESIQKCLEGAKKPALQISGGLDSAIIQAIAKIENLYCCTFPLDNINNMEIAELAAKGVKVNPVTFTYNEMLDVLPAVKSLTDGKGTWSQVCQYILCKKMAQDGCDVVLTGEGADELFGGYARYRILHHLDKIWNDPKLSAYHGIAHVVPGTRRELLVRMLSRNMHRSFVDEMIPQDCSDSLVRIAMNFEEKYSLPALLQFGQSMAEAHGMKCMFPYMAQTVVEYAHGLDSMDFVDDQYNKVILRHAALALDVHPDIVNEKTKRGLFIPPNWRPSDAPTKWGREWFEKLMEAA